jgi:hypothetical protein
VTTDIDTGEGQATSTINDKDMNNRHNIVLEDVDVQNQATINMVEDKKKKRQSEVKNRYHKITRDSPPISDQFKSNPNEEEIYDQKQETIVTENIGNSNVGTITKNQRMVDVAIIEQNRLDKNTMNDIDADLGPVVGYAEEPLLPLAEACAPLINIIHDMLVYVQMALDETPAEPPNGLTIDESAAIRLYTIEWARPHRSLYSMLNRTLKKDSREHLRPYFRYMKLFLTALVKIPCIPQSTVWRGVTKNASAEFPPGTPVTWWAFSSCTTELTVLESNMYLGNAGSRTLFSVEAINARSVRAHSYFDTEDEVLLPPGTHMIVQSQFSPAPDLHIIHLKQVKPDEILLEPPFEGNFNILITHLHYSISIFQVHFFILKLSKFKLILSYLYF